MTRGRRRDTIRTAFTERATTLVAVPAASEPAAPGARCPHGRARARGGLCTSACLSRVVAGAIGRIVDLAHEPWLTAGDRSFRPFWRGQARMRSGPSG